MTDYLLLFVGTVLVNNFVLVKFLGLCPFMGVSKKLETAMGMGLATTFVMTLASICAWLIDTWILIPLNLIYLRTLAFILVIAVVVQFTEMVVRKTSPALYRLLGIFLPLITTNCAVLGVALLNINLGHNFLQSALYGFSAAVGFSLVMVLFAAIRERLAVADVPAPFRGNAIALITAGLMSLAFMGFSGSALSWVTPPVVTRWRMILSWKKSMRFCRRASVGNAAIPAVAPMRKRLAVRVKKLTAVRLAAKR